MVDPLDVQHHMSVLDQAVSELREAIRNAPPMGELALGVQLAAIVEKTVMLAVTVGRLDGVALMEEAMRTGKAPAAF